LKQYSKSKPSPKKLLSVAQRTFLNYATAAPKTDIREMDSSKEEGDSHTDTDPDAQTQHDPMPNKECVQVPTADAGGNNYCTEILHFIFNLKHVWTPEFVFVVPQCLKYCQLMLFQGYHAR
jgi:hypothetical protein